ncbi:MAG: hypothetical protein KF773_00055 [Deltaproteobacteria bacterium]|nr:hypothetical protein [Deltaproteobacteria bacterium]MCW5807750.1 hypothetical protein [Deltaproteobacteria bacterium]
MIVFSNRRLGPAAELLVSREVARAMLAAMVEAARPRAAGRWEHELVRWLEGAAAGATTTLRAVDVAEIAWTPDHFESQRRFLLEAVEEAEGGSEHARPLGLWKRMIEAHPRDSVQFGRRWSAHTSA